jgi:hypothetical protein
MENSTTVTSVGGNEEYALDYSVADDGNDDDGAENTTIPPVDVVVWAMVTIWMYLIRKLVSLYLI